MDSTSETRAAVLTALEEIVAAAPDTVADCVYFDYGDSPDEPNAPAPVVPVCIVGHLIKRLEPETFEAMVERELTGEEPSIGSILVEKLHEYGVRLSFDQDRNLVWALSVLQGAQDGGRPWKEALWEFKRQLRLMDEGLT